MPPGTETRPEDALLWQADGWPGAADRYPAPRGEDATLLLVLNEFSLPETAGGGEWSLLIDTNLVEDVEPKSFATGDQYGATGRSVLLFALRSAVST
jgi:hypothetical protein